MGASRFWTLTGSESIVTPPDDGGGKGKGKDKPAGWTGGGKGGGWGKGGKNGSDVLSSIVSFQCSFDGADLATEATDESIYAHPITFGSAANLSTTAPKFGTASVTGDGTGNGSLIVANHTSLNFEGEDHTIEFWFKRNGEQGNVIDLIAKWLSGGGHRQWIIEYNHTTNRFDYFISTDGNNTLVGAAYDTDVTGGTPWDNAWHHMAATREGDVYRLFLDGVMGDVSNTQAGALNANTAISMEILGSDIGSQEFNGFMDELRITKGLARYTANFTPPAAPF